MFASSFSEQCGQGMMSGRPKSTSFISTFHIESMFFSNQPVLCRPHTQTRIALFLGLRMNIPKPELFPIRVPRELSRIAFPIVVLPKDDHTDFAQDERLDLPYWTMIWAICVLVDVSKYLDRMMFATNPSFDLTSSRCLLPVRWRRWMRRPGGRVESPPCTRFKSVIVFFEAFTLLIKPLPDLLCRRDWFVSFSSDFCMFVIQSFAFVLRVYKVTADSLVLEYLLYSKKLSRIFRSDFFHALWPRRNGLPMRFHRIEWYVPRSTQYLTKTCGICHHRAIFPEWFCNHHFCAYGLSSAYYVLCGTWLSAQMASVWHREWDFFFLMA